MRRPNETQAKVERVRLFVALDVPEAVRNSLEELTRQLQKICRKARWATLLSAHVTLKFIGQVPIEKAERIGSALRDVHTRGPIQLRFAGLGFFPSARRARVLWAGVSAPELHAAPETEARGLSELGRLAAAIENALAPADIPPENREFHPHITLAKFNSPDGLDSLRVAVSERTNSEFGSALASEFHLYRSVLKPAGAEYTRLESYPLCGERLP